MISPANAAPQDDADGFVVWPRSDRTYRIVGSAPDDVGVMVEAAHHAMGLTADTKSGVLWVRRTPRMAALHVIFGDPFSAEAVDARALVQGGHDRSLRLAEERAGTEPCYVLRLTSRQTWIGAAYLVMREDIEGEQLRTCIERGTAFANGYPSEARIAYPRHLPPAPKMFREVARLYDCSRNGLVTARAEGPTRAGLSAPVRGDCFAQPTGSE